ncbi:MAG: N-acetylmuramoyl-L-alanine amidase [Planctomycetes bacterium]|nr:N-acetylmuramoyl-L-alanine amidase [Planctomycetota bacterium]
MHRTYLGGLVGLLLATTVACYHPHTLETPAAAQPVAAVHVAKPAPSAPPQGVPQAPPELTPEERDMVRFYDLTAAHGFKVSIDLVTGRRVCKDRSGVNELVIMPSADYLVINGRHFPLGSTIRWRDGVLYLPGEARAIVAENVRRAPVARVQSTRGLFNGSEPGLTEWVPASARRAPSKSAAAPTTMPAAWRVKGERRWRFIVIHHSATDAGGAVSFGREHAKKWQNGLGYHFVIGNGTHTGAGEIEVGTRWKRQGQGIDGAHAGNKLYNQYGIGVCLVGEFNHGQPSAQQMESLRALCRTLMKRYGISKDRVFGHQQVRKGHTDCPGKHFPLEAFKRTL